MRTFDVTYGIVDGEQMLYASEKPMWEARLHAIRLCRVEEQANEKMGNDELARTFTLLIADLRDAGAGGLLDGFVRTYIGLDEAHRFLAVVPHEMDYRDARRVAANTYRPSRDA